MKIDDLPGLHEAVSGKLVSNKRVQQWEEEFLSQQKRFGSKEQEVPLSAKSRDFSSLRKDTGRPSLPRDSFPALSGAAKGSQSGTVAVSDPKVAGQRVAGLYNRVTGQAFGAGSGRSPTASASRPDVRSAAALAGAQRELARFKGYLVVEREGVVSIWLGRKLNREDKCHVIAGITKMLAECGLRLDRLTINGIEEEI